MSILFILTLFIFIKLNSGHALEDNKNLFEIVEADQSELEVSGDKKASNFDHWTYSEKSMYCYSIMYRCFNMASTKMPAHSRYILIKEPRWFMIDRNGFKMNFHGWMEQGTNIAGCTTKEFVELLDSFRLDDQYSQPFILQLKKTFVSMKKEVFENRDVLAKKIRGLETELDKLDQRFTYGTYGNVV